jgi:ketosteroid isomerase-like protein
MNDVGGAIAADDAMARAILATEDDWTNAILSNDADWIETFVADDWVIVSDSGITPRQRFLEVIRSGQLSHSAMAASGEPRIRVYGDTAIVTVRVVSTAHYQGHRLDADEWTTDVFDRHSDGRWLCRLTHITTARRS